jgi:hypothetical protein
VRQLDLSSSGSSSANRTAAASTLPAHAPTPPAANKAT